MSKLNKNYESSYKRFCKKHNRYYKYTPALFGRGYYICEECRIEDDVLTLKDTLDNVDKLYQGKMRGYFSEDKNFKIEIYKDGIWLYKNNKNPGYPEIYFYEDHEDIKDMGTKFEQKDNFLIYKNKNIKFNLNQNKKGQFVKKA